MAGSSETVGNHFEEAQEPFNAGAWVKCRQQAEVLASASDSGNKKMGKVEKFTPLDFTAMVLHKNFLTPNAVLAHVQEYGSHAFQLYCLRNPKRLSDLIEGALQWRDAKQLHCTCFGARDGLGSSSASRKYPLHLLRTACLVGGCV